MSTVSWFEIPVYDITRATAFYNLIFGCEMELSQNGDHTMAFFPGLRGALVTGPGCVPSDVGVLVYLDAGGDLDGVLGRVEFAGGRVVMPRSFISEESGSFALFIDSEGNRLALHEAPTQVAAESPSPSAGAPDGTRDNTSSSTSDNLSSNTSGNTSGSTSGNTSGSTSGNTTSKSKRKRDVAKRR